MKDYGAPYGRNLKFIGEADTTIIHYSLFIIHFSFELRLPYCERLCGKGLKAVEDCEICGI